ncbi:MAG: hypothetical protein KZQ88_15545 [Candidatus Thiodiazotropha sp. (ex Dulcina madagascariensis)]|nr:hypothetical protein [Candidatus Thiodiazotropha sp. (ex Dulcina madagascariensis)]MCU7928535.1 hypothetical protein [Candidatus Thiodiazotropha sp. (ex Dulcina madagascariensis)]
MERKDKQVQLDKDTLCELEKTRGELLVHLFASQQVPTKVLAKAMKYSGITHWEALSCVGFNPEVSQLEAVVTIKQASGYSGNLCSDGSTEYVRFFVDWGDGAGFQDVGLTSFKAYNISNAPPGPQHPLQQMVYLPLDDAKFQRCCKTEVIPRVRAVLAWNQIPSLDPDALPVYGNRVDARIQLDSKWNLFCLLHDLNIDLQKEAVFKKIDLNAELKLKASKPIPLKALWKQYKAAGVPEHRLLFDTLYPMLAGGKNLSLAAMQPDLSVIGELDIDLSAVVGMLADESANTSYEELVCAGLNTATDTLGAVIHVKKSSGYSGGLCDSGSREHVAFWADWNNDGNYDDYLGTASVEVHDLDKIPAQGVYYSVLLPLNLGDKVKQCADPNVARIRAVLSWSVPPSSSDPDHLNTWGNRLDRLVRIRHGAGPGQGLYDLIYHVGGVPIDNIDPLTYLANPSGGVLNCANCAQPAMDRPFGGRVHINGRIYNTGLPGTVHYQVQYAPAGTGIWLPVTNSASYRLAHPNPLDPLHPVDEVMVNSPDGWFPYQENPLASPPILEERARLATWSTGALNGAFDLRLAYTTDYPGLNPANIRYSDVVSVIIDNDGFSVSPDANVAVDVGYDLDIVIDGGDCHHYLQGDVIQGHLRAKDSHFWKWTLNLQPSTHTHGLQASPHCRSYGSLADDGDDNAAWQLHTEQGSVAIDPCGYTLTLRAYDRAIIDSNGAVVHEASKAVGFCVEGSDDS